MQHFLWRLAHNALPTREVLFRQKIVQDTTCFRCMGLTETAMHALHDYAVSSSILLLMGWAQLLATLPCHDAAI